MAKKILQQPAKEKHEQVAVLLSFPANVSDKQVQELINACNLPHNTTFQKMNFDPSIGSVVIYQP